MLIDSTIVSKRDANLEYGQLMQNDEWMKAELTVIYSKAGFLFWLSNLDAEEWWRPLFSE